MRRTCYQQIGLFDESMSLSEDIDLLFRLLNSNVGYVSIPSVLIKIHIHPAPRLSRLPNYIRHAECQQHVIDKNARFLNQHQDLWLHYHDCLASTYFGAHNKQRARKIMCAMLKKKPFRLHTWEQLIRFELVHSLR